MRIDGTQQGRAGWAIKAMMKAIERHPNSNTVSRLGCVCISRLCAPASLAAPQPNLTPEDAYRSNQTELAENGAPEFLVRLANERAVNVAEALRRVENKFAAYTGNTDETLD